MDNSPKNENPVSIFSLVCSGEVQYLSKSTNNHIHIYFSKSRIQ